MIALLLASTPTFKVLGIDCALCAPPVKKALASVPGVTNVRVDTGAKTATVNHRSCRGNGDMVSICRQPRTDLETGGKAAGRAVSHEPKRHRQAEQQQAHR